MKNISIIFVFLLIQASNEVLADQGQGRILTFPGQFQEKLNIPNGANDPYNVDILNINYLEQTAQLNKYSIVGGRLAIFVRIDHSSALNGPQQNTSIAPGGGLKLVWLFTDISVQVGSRFAYEIVRDTDTRALVNVYVEGNYRWDLSR